LGVAGDDDENEMLIFVVDSIGLSLPIYNIFAIYTSTGAKWVGIFAVPVD